MSNNGSKTITVVLVLLVVIAVIAVIAKKHSTAQAPVTQGAATTVTQTQQVPSQDASMQSMQQDPAAAQIQSSGASDQSLSQDGASIDAQLKSASTDSSDAQQ